MKSPGQVTVTNCAVFVQSEGLNFKHSQGYEVMIADQCLTESEQHILIIMGFYSWFSVFSAMHFAPGGQKGDS